MASSNVNMIPYIIKTLKKIEFSSLLDVGTGFGKWGCLVREYCDLMKAKSPADFQKGQWHIRIDGIEAFPDFISDLHRYVYDNIYVGRAEQVIDDLGSYDVIVMVAVLAHFPEDVGLSLLRRLYQHAAKALLITIPTRYCPQDDVFQNPHEVHHPVEWWHADFSFADHIAKRDLPPGERILVMSHGEPIPIADPYRVRKRGARSLVRRLLGR